MTTYATVTAAERAADAALTTINFGKTIDNPLAMFEGAGGAPRLQEGALDSAVVSQGKLKTTTASGSQALTAGGQASYSLTGGTYSWWTGSSGVTLSQGISFGNGNTGAGVIGLVNDYTSAGQTFYADERYVQASPPYYLGDLVALFIFALIDKSTGEIVALRVSEDPPWAYHGPTNIEAGFYDAHGQPWRYESKYMIDHYQEGAPLPITQIKDPDPERRALGLWRLNNEAYKTPILITSEIKNRDINLVPHWFGDFDQSKFTAVMIDPCGNIAIELMEVLHSAGAKETHQLIEDGYIKLSTSPLDCVAPAGVMAINARWK
jgi:hypothetical protein